MNQSDNSGYWTFKPDTNGKYTMTVGGVGRVLDLSVALHHGERRFWVRAGLLRGGLQSDRGREQCEF